MVPKSSPVRLGRPLGAHFGNLGGLLGDSWGTLGALLGALGRSWGSFWRVPGAILASVAERCGAFGAQEMISDDLETNLIDLGTILNGLFI